MTWNSRGFYVGQVTMARPAPPVPQPPPRLPKLKQIPIILNNFNRLSTTKKLAGDLYSLGYANIHILDNNSTYAPLLQWYQDCPYTVKRLEANMEQLAIYNSGYINEFIKEPWIVYSDSDVELFAAIPENFISRIIEKAEKYGYTKAGLALRINDLPDNEYANHYRQWEAKYWQKQVEPDVYEADIDTTFCIIKPGQPFDYKALRLGGNLTARHVPWYVDFDGLDEEEKYYLQNSRDWSTYKRFYNSYVKNMDIIDRKKGKNPGLTGITKES
jgi:hypothetical protein